MSCLLCGSPFPSDNFRSSSDTHVYSGVSTQMRLGEVRRTRGDFNRERQSFRLIMVFCERAGESELAAQCSPLQRLSSSPETNSFFSHVVSPRRLRCRAHDSEGAALHPHPRRSGGRLCFQRLCVRARCNPSATRASIARASQTWPFEVPVEILRGRLPPPPRCRLACITKTCLSFRGPHGKHRCQRGPPRGSR